MAINISYSYLCTYLHIYALTQLASPSTQQCLCLPHLVLGLSSSVFNTTSMAVAAVAVLLSLPLPPPPTLYIVYSPIVYLVHGCILMCK